MFNALNGVNLIYSCKKYVIPLCSFKEDEGAKNIPIAVNLRRGKCFRSFMHV